MCPDGEQVGSVRGSTLRQPIKVEVERTFLLRNDEWRKHAIDQQIVRDGLIVSINGSKVRVRIIGDKATLAVKGRRKGCSRVEYEYPIPVADAEHLLKTCCSGGIVEKSRYRVPYAGKMWEIDVFITGLDGPDLAEIELASEDEPFLKPAWLGAEVTGNPHYSKRAMKGGAQKMGKRMTSSGPEATLWGYFLSAIRVLVASLVFTGAACWAAAAQAEVYPGTKSGKHLAEVHCVGCHSTGTSHDTFGGHDVSTLLELAPKIASDPEWYRLFLTNPHREMVGVSLNRAEIEALFAYILSLESAP